MVGSVLLQRMIEENDFDDISAHFFSTSSVGGVGPVINGKRDRLKDANSLSALAEMDIIITCQGEDYTKAIADVSSAYGADCPGQRRVNPSGDAAQNAFIERLNRTYQTEILDFYLFRTLNEAREIRDFHPLARSLTLVDYNELLNGYGVSSPK